MGQKLSIQEQREYKADIYAYYPGLEQQLDMAFACHDMQSQGKLSYSALEPVLRHLLLQYGVIEFMTRFCTENGELDPTHIEKDLQLFGLWSSMHPDSMLTCEQFKSVAVIWLKRILDANADDQAVWIEKLRISQEEQRQAYMKAIEEFQSQFIQSSTAYAQGIKEQEALINDWNRSLEETEKGQKKVDASMEAQRKARQYREENALTEAQLEQQRILQKYQEELRQLQTRDGRNICFVYSSASTPFGACASAGAQRPVRRRKYIKSSNQQKFLGKEIHGWC